MYWNSELIAAHDLAGSGQGGFNDPYIRLTLSPEVDSRKRQTAIHRNDPNPYFNEHFKFPVSREDLKDKTLVMQVRQLQILYWKQDTWWLKYPILTLFVFWRCLFISDLFGETKKSEGFFASQNCLGFQHHAERLKHTECL